MKRKLSKGPKGSGVTYQPKKKARTWTPPKYYPRQNGETKYFDSERTTTAIAVSGADWTNTELDPTTANCLFFPSPGTAYNNREGRKVYVKKMKINGWIQVDPTEGTDIPANCTNCRVIVYQDKQTNGQQSQGEQLMDSGGSNLATLMFQNTANFGRFQVLKDKSFTFPNPSITWDGTNIVTAPFKRLFKISLKFNQPILVNYNNTNGSTVADIVDNSFHLIANASDGDYPVSLGYKVRTVFCE